MLQSDLYDYSDAYAAVKGTVTVTDSNNNNVFDKKLAFKNNVPFISSISKINNTLTDNAEDLDVVMPMYNLIEYSKKYSKTTGNVWNYYRDKPNSDVVEDINYSVRASKMFDYKTSITGRLEGDNTEKEVEIAVSLKHLRTLHITLINYEINLILTWSKNCVITSKATRDADIDAIPEVAAVNNPTDATFEINDTKLHVPVVALSTEDDNKLSEPLKVGFKRTIKRNKYRSEMSEQAKTNNLNYLIDLTFDKVNRLFILSFENEKDRTSFSEHYTPRVEIKDFNLLIDSKSFFDAPIKYKEETYEKIIEMSKNNYCTTDNLLDYD